MIDTEHLSPGRSGSSSFNACRGARNGFAPASASDTRKSLASSNISEPCPHIRGFSTAEPHDQPSSANPPWLGAFRRRLALAAAAASVARAGRSEDEAVLRDALHLSRPGADPGPAGRHWLAWRALTSVSAGQWRSAIAVAAGHLGAPNVEALQTAIEAAEACAASPRLASFAAARGYHLARRALAPAQGRAGEGEPLAAWLADAVLAQKLGWPFPPLLAEPLFSRARQRKVLEADEAAETSRVLFAYAQAAEKACDLAADLRRRAQKAWTQHSCQPPPLGLAGARPRVLFRYSSDPVPL